MHEHQYRARSATITLNITERYIKVTRQNLDLHVFRKVAEWEADAYTFFMRGLWRRCGY